MEKNLIGIATENIEAFNNADWTRLKTPFAPNATYHEVGTQRRLQGVDAIVQTYQAWKKAAPDCTGKITNSFASGNNVAIEVTWTGTQTGPLEGPKGIIPPSGKTWTVMATQIITFRDDKIQQFRQYFDMMTLLQQIGAVPK